MMLLSEFRTQKFKSYFTLLIFELKFTFMNRKCCELMNTSKFVSVYKMPFCSRFLAGMREIEPNL